MLVKMLEWRDAVTLRENLTKECFNILNSSLKVGVDGEIISFWKRSVLSILGANSKLDRERTWAEIHLTAYFKTLKMCK